MSRHTRVTWLLVATLGIVLTPIAGAWIPYGYGPYDPGYQGGYPGAEPPAPPMGARSYEPNVPPSAGLPGGYGGQSVYPYGAEVPPPPYGEAPSGAAPPAPVYPGYGPRSGSPSWGYPGSGGPGFGPRPGFRISRASSDDAYALTIALEGMDPEEVQVRAQGQWILVSRERTEQQVQKDSFDDGRGFTRSFSYSSGTASRRLSVPRDGDLSAMIREDSEGSIHIRIPRRGR